MQTIFIAGYRLFSIIEHTGRSTRPAGRTWRTLSGHSIGSRVPGQHATRMGRGTLGKQRKLKEAELLQREIVESCIADVPMRWTSSTMHVLALILIARDAVGEGLSLHLKAAAMTGGEPRSDQSGDSSWCHRIVRSLVRNNHFEAAEDYTHKINTKCEQVLGPNDTRTLNVRRWLADILASRESSSRSSDTSSAPSDRPKHIVASSSTGRPMKISRWRLRPFFRRRVIVQLPRRQSRQWEEVSTAS